MSPLDQLKAAIAEAVGQPAEETDWMDICEESCSAKELIANVQLATAQILQRIQEVNTQLLHVQNTVGHRLTTLQQGMTEVRDLNDSRAAQMRNLHQAIEKMAMVKVVMELIAKKKKTEPPPFMYL